MTRVRVHNFTISLDGYGAGPRQTREEPLGAGGEEVHDWYIPTRTFQRMGGKTGGTTGVDDDFAARFGEGVGAWIMGRNMFGPIRGPWPDDAWRGWWGRNPPYHGPVFVLTHHERPPAQMEGGTVFHFVTGGIGEAMERATEAAAGRDVEIGGGVSTVRQTSKRDSSTSCTWRSRQDCSGRASTSCTASTSRAWAMSARPMCRPKERPTSC